jgi:tripartite-type tricarboxylate transporter receptor subunit TctC
LLLAIGAMTAWNGSANAQSTADFYKGKTVTVLIGYTPGGGYDNYAREIARYMGRYIPGNPTLVPQNMPGAGSLQLANYLYNVAPKDGTVFGIFGRGLPMDPLLQPGSGAQFDASKFTWLGSVANEVSVCAVWKTSPVQQWSDVTKKQFSVGGTGGGSDPDVFANVLKNVFGAKIKLVSGYPGGNDISFAMERGEVDGRCGWSWSSIKGTRMSWLKDGQMKILVQLSLSKAKDMVGDPPLVTDLATNDEQRQVLKLIFSRQVTAWPFAAPPGLPDDRKEALRKAFDGTMTDKDFVADLQKFGLEVSPAAGTDMEKLIGELYKTPPDIVAKARMAVQ